MTGMPRLALALQLSHIDGSPIRVRTGTERVALARVADEAKVRSKKAAATTVPDALTGVALPFDW